MLDRIKVVLYIMFGVPSLRHTGWGVSCRIVGKCVDGNYEQKGNTGVSLLCEKKRTFRQVFKSDLNAH